MKSEIKKVASSGSLQRWILLHPVTKIQVAVLTSSAPNLYILSVPIEGMGGWQVRCSSMAEAQKVANRECSICGKLLNRFVGIPLFLIQGKLS